MSTDITQVVDGTTAVISKDVKMRMTSNLIQPKSLSYPKNDFLDKQAKDGIKKRSCLREWLTNNPSFFILKLLTECFVYVAFSFLQAHIKDKEPKNSLLSPIRPGGRR